MDYYFIIELIIVISFIVSLSFNFLLIARDSYLIRKDKKKPYHYEYY